MWGERSKGVEIGKRYLNRNVRYGSKPDLSVMESVRWGGFSRGQKRAGLRRTKRGYVGIQSIEKCSNGSMNTVIRALTIKNCVERSFPVSFCNSSYGLTQHNRMGNAFVCWKDYCMTSTTRGLGGYFHLLSILEGQKRRCAGSGSGKNYLRIGSAAADQEHCFVRKVLGRRWADFWWSTNVTMVFDGAVCWWLVFICLVRAI